MGISRATAYRYLVAMNESGMLFYDGKTILTKQAGKCSTGYCSAPVVGSIRCGDPELEEELVEEYVSLPTSIFGEGPFYILRAKGDSMVDAGIAEGDLIVIRRQESAEVGDTVVALDEENENTLKIFGGVDEETGEAILRYANQKKVPRHGDPHEAPGGAGRGKTRHQGFASLRIFLLRWKGRKDLCSNWRCGAHFPGIAPTAGQSPWAIRTTAGTIKVECSRCHAVMVRKVMGRRHDRIDIYAPKGEVNETGWASGL